MVWHATVAADRVPLEVFGRLPSLEDVAISPDGTKIAFVRTKGEIRNLAVTPVTNSEILGGVRIGEAKLRALEWVDDDNLLATASTTSVPPIGFVGRMGEWRQIANFNVSAQKLDAFSFAVSRERTFNLIAHAPSLREVSGRMVLYASGYCVRDVTDPCLFAFGYPDRRARLVVQAADLSIQWYLDETGNIAAQSTYQDDKQLWEIKTRQNGGRRRSAMESAQSVG